jgi:hypothetical protein
MLLIFTQAPLSKEVQIFQPFQIIPEGEGRTENAKVKMT